MPNIASILKSEIERIARKQIRAEGERTNNSIRAYRTEIAALKRRAQSLEQQVKQLQKSAPKPELRPMIETGKVLRFSAKGLSTQRRRLELSADALGLLIGVSGQSVYNWEAGKARPHAVHMAAIRALTALPKRQADEVVAARKAAP